MNSPSEQREFLFAVQRLSCPWAAKEAGILQTGVQAIGRALPAAGRAISGFMANKVAPVAQRLFTNNAAQTAALVRNAVPSVAKVVPPTTANSAGHLAWQAARGTFGFGSSANASRLGKAVATGAGITAVGAPIAVGAMGHADGPSQQQMGRAGYAALDEGALYTVKAAWDTDKIRAGVDLGGYAALAAPLATKIVAPKFYEQHHGLMHGLDIAGLGALTATSGYGLATGKKKLPDALDMGGLGLMGLALHRRLTDPEH